DVAPAAVVVVSPDVGTLEPGTVVVVEDVEVVAEPCRPKSPGSWSLEHAASTTTASVPTTMARLPFTARVSQNEAAPEVSGPSRSTLQHAMTQTAPATSLRHEP